jgi:hypothetical protein
MVRNLLQRLLIQWVSHPHIHFREKCSRLLDYTSIEAYKISLAGHYGKHLPCEVCISADEIDSSIAAAISPDIVLTSVSIKMDGSSKLQTLRTC